MQGDKQPIGLTRQLQPTEDLIPGSVLTDSTRDLPEVLRQLNL
jgi:hypothetical protein